jgi:hypothetical protein
MIAWSVLAVAMLGDASGVIFDLYANIWWYDKALHCFFSFAVTLLLAMYAYGVLTHTHHLQDSFGKQDSGKFCRRSSRASARLITLALPR